MKSTVLRCRVVSVAGARVGVPSATSTDRGSRSPASVRSFKQGADASGVIQHHKWGGRVIRWK
eukprot:2313544-Prymnesium_polylepis.1